jgi:ABC-type transport system involved in multi-copper enzyme maturation permease subunit
MLRFASDFVFFAQRPEVTDWLTPVWLLAVGIGFGFILAMAMLFKLAVLQKISFFNSISENPKLYQVSSLLLSAVYVGLFLIYYRWQYGSLALSSDLIFALVFVIPSSLLIGYGAWKLVAKRMAGETWALATEGFLGWMNRIGIVFLMFAILGAILAPLNGLGVVKFVDHPGEMMQSLARLPFAGSQVVEMEVPPSPINHTGDTSSVEFHGSELVSISVATDQQIELSTETITPNTNRSRVYDIEPTEQPLVIPKNFARLIDKDYDTFYVNNLGAAAAKVRLEVRTAPLIPEVAIIPATAVCVVMIYLLHLLFSALAPKVSAIALSTFKTEVSQPLYLLVALIGIVFVVASIFIPYNTFGEDIKLYKESGLTLIRVLAIFTAIWAASKSVAEEIEGRTALTVLSKPVGRRQFIFGKFSGISLAIALLFIVLGLWFVIWTAYKPIYDGRENTAKVEDWAQCFTEATFIIPAIFLCFLEVVIFVAISVSLSTRFGILPNFLICFAIYILGHLTPMMVQSDLVEFAPVVTFSNLIAVIFPVLDHFDVRAAINNNEWVPPQYLGWAMIYTFLYGTIAMLLSLVLFEDRDLA